MYLLLIQPLQNFFLPFYNYWNNIDICNCNSKRLKSFRKVHPAIHRASTSCTHICFNYNAIKHVSRLHLRLNIFVTTNLIKFLIQSQSAVTDWVFRSLAIN